MDRIVPNPNAAGLPTADQSSTSPDAARFQRMLSLVDARATEDPQPPTANVPKPRVESRIFAQAAALQASKSKQDDSFDSPPSQKALVDVLVTSHGKSVGSFYFSDRRVRATHVRGPKEFPHAQETLRRFNVNKSQAMRAFDQIHPTARKDALAEQPRTIARAERRKLADRAYFGDLKNWVVQTLSQSETTPSWAEAVTGPASVGPFEAVAEDPEAVLVEVFENGSDEQGGWHFSRGQAARLSVPQESLDALEGALDAVRDIDDPVSSNRRFYDYVTSKAPDLAATMRKP